MTTQTPDALREAVARIVDPASWPERLPSTRGAAGRFAQYQARSLAKADAILAAIAAFDSRAGDAGEVERLRKGLERARSDLHLVTLHGSVRPMWEEAKAARDTVHEVLAATPAPAVDAVPAGEGEQ